MASAPSWAPNRRVPGTDYRILRRLGAGGMGEVFEVDDERTGRRLALKAIHAHFGVRDDLRQRFRDEARVLGQLHEHPHLVEVVYAGEAADGRAYLVMELLKGCSLEHELDVQHDAPVPFEVLVPWACGVLRQVLAALGAAHAIGVLHRDVKPGNVFLRARGGVKLLDFGLAAFLAPREGVELVTLPGQIMGTAAYLPPERLRGEPADERADVFAAGVVLWEMLARERAIVARDASAAAAQMLQFGVPPLASRPGLLLPPALLWVVDTATAYEARDRFPSVEAFGEALRAATRRLGVLTSPRPLAGLARAPAEGASRSQAVTRRVRFGLLTPPPSSPRARAIVDFGALAPGRDRRGPSAGRRVTLASARGAGAALAAPTPDVGWDASRAGRLRWRLRLARYQAGVRVFDATRALDAWQRRRLRTSGQRAWGALVVLLLAYALGTLMAHCRGAPGP